MGTRRHTGLVVALAAVAAAAVLGAAACGRSAPGEVSSPLPVRALRPSELTYKADLLESLPEPPQLIFFGGSRSERFDPSYARKVTGLPTFNFSATNARPEAAWAIANWLLARSPQTQLRWVWGVQASTLWDRPLDPGLLQDTRFMSHLPRSLLSDQLQVLPAGPPPTTSFLDRRRYSADGMLLWNSYDARRARGLTLEDSLSQYIGKAVARMERVSEAGGVSGSGRSRARAYFVKTLKLLNDHGTTPLIVLMPVHPQVLSVMRAHGWQQSRGKLLDYLLALQRDYSLAILDLTEIASFGGDPAEFYDGVHITKENADRAIEQMARSAGSELE